MGIRVSDPDDAEAVALLRSVVYPFMVRSARAVRYQRENASPAERRVDWVSEVDGAVVGAATGAVMIETAEPGFGMLNVYVHPEARGHGYGTALYEAAMAHLREIGCRRVRVFVLPESLGFARRHRFEPTRELRYSRADLAVLPVSPPIPDGVTVVPLSQLDPREVFAADSAASMDEPTDVAYEPNYESWLVHNWDNPDLDRETSFAAIVDDRVAALTLLETVGVKTWSGFTGTVPAYRGRGLAKLLKSVALRRAAALGVTEAYTSNDETNAPMLAVNTWLGYRPVAAQWGCLAGLS